MLSRHDYNKERTAWLQSCFDKYYIKEKNDGTDEEHCFHGAE